MMVTRVCFACSSPRTPLLVARALHLRLQPAPLAVMQAYGIEIAAWNIESKKEHVFGEESGKKTRRVRSTTHCQIGMPARASRSP